MTTAAGPPKDTTPPTLTLKLSKSTLKRLLKSRKLVVKVTVNEASTVPLTASTKLKRRHKKAKTVTLGKATAKFTSARTKKVTIKLTKKGRRDAEARCARRRSR